MNFVPSWQQRLALARTCWVSFFKLTHSPREGTAPPVMKVKSGGWPTISITVTSGLRKTVIAGALGLIFLVTGCRRAQPSKDASSSLGKSSPASAASFAPTPAAPSGHAGSAAAVETPAPQPTAAPEAQPAIAAEAQPQVGAETQPVGSPGMDGARIEQSGPVSCADYGKYLVISQELQDEVGSNTLVKFKQAKEHIPCAYSAGPSDFEIKNGGGDFFIGLHGDLLFLDSSTGPGTAGLTIYNVASRKKVFETGYLGPTQVTADTMSLWQVEKTATTAACPDAERITRQGLTPTLERRMLLNLQTFALAETKDTRCGVEQ